MLDLEVVRALAESLQHAEDVGNLREGVAATLRTMADELEYLRKVQLRAQGVMQQGSHIGGHTLFGEAMRLLRNALRGELP